MGSLFIILPIIVFIVVLVFALANQYVTAAPDEALIISGSLLGNKSVTENKEGNKLKILRGGGAFVLPMFQKKKSLSLLSSKLGVSVSEVYTAQGVPVIADGIVVIKIGSSVEQIVTAAEQYLSKPRLELESEAREVLEGHLRAILGSMTVENILQNRDEFNENVQKVASVDLAKMGLVIVSFTLRDIDDSVGYISALGQKQISEIKRDANIAMSESQKETRIRQAQANEEATREELLRKTMTDESDKDRQLKLSAFQQETAIAKANAETAYDIERAMLAKQLKIQQMEVVIVERDKQIELESKETIRRERQYDSEVKKKADAERYATEQSAVAEKNKKISEAEANARTVQLQGEAEANRITQINMATAESEAKSIALKGQAESETILAIGLAQAEAKEKMAQAFKQYGEAAIATLVIENLADIVRASAEPLGNIDKITVFDGGNGEGAGRISALSTGALIQAQETLKETTGIDIKALLEGFAGNSNLGSKLTQIANAYDCEPETVEAYEAKTVELDMVAERE